MDLFVTTSNRTLARVVYAEISFFNDWFLKTVEILKQYEITIRQVQSMLECFASHIRKKNYQISSRT